MRKKGVLKFQSIIALLLVFVQGMSLWGGLIEAYPLMSSSAKSDGTRFELLSPEKSGVTLGNAIDLQHPLKRVYYAGSACGGVAIGDVDLDGKLDFFAANGPGGNALYLQVGDMVFKDKALEKGLTGGRDAWGVGVSLIDIDNDGDLDIYVVNYDYPNQLFINQLIGDDGAKSSQGISFVERAKEMGLAVIDGCIGAAFCDYDRDGDLDMYLLTLQVYREGGRPATDLPLVMTKDGLDITEEWKRWYGRDRGVKGAVAFSEKGRPDRLYRNDEGKFVEVTQEAGITTAPRWGNSVTWWDYNHDGWPDIYVSNDFADPDYLYRNNGDGTFAEVADLTLRHTSWFSMGSVQADLNNDGWVDLVVTDMMPSTHFMQKVSMATMGDRLENLLAVPGARQLMRNSVHLNTGTDYMMEAAYLSGLAQTEWTWSVRAADFDNDGNTDLFFTNGAARVFNDSDESPALSNEMLIGKNKWDYFENKPERREKNKAYRNLGGLKFEAVGKRWGLDHFGMSYGVSVGDLNGDGCLDMIVANLEDSLSIYRNRGGKASRIVVELKGRGSNRQGIGAMLTLELKGGGKQVRQLFPTGGFLNGDAAQVHFGLGEETEIFRLKVEWPSGVVQEFGGLPVNHRYVITEGVATDIKKKKAEKNLQLKAPMFVESQVLKGFGVKEVPFDDYARQPLLPLGLSQLGPGQAWGDVDGDGDDDFYLGGSTGQAGRLFINQTEPGADQPVLVPLPVIAFGEDSGYEDMGQLFFDADSDGDLDLYVVSGSIECEPEAKVLRDRLYLNDGKGGFSRAPSHVLPDIRLSGSVVAGADFDRDGDVDLFVGSRSIPGKYPVAPESVLLENRGGRFKNVVKHKSVGLEKGGMVTSALWSDVNADGWVDLLVTHDWGAVKLYMNNEGVLVDKTDWSGLGKELGWWNGIAGGDIDNDGDVDFVVSNYGLNTQYQASVKSPEMIYYGDFDKTGKAHILEASFENEVCYPRRGFSCTSLAMPMIADKMQTYRKFASASLTRIIPANRLSQALSYRVNTLESSVLLNDGGGHFVVKKLPRLAQIAPVFGLALTDVDLDGRLDCYLVQNFFEPQIETGPFDGGLSLLLKGTGKSEPLFEEVWPAESGLTVPGDARSLAVVDLNRDGRQDFVIGVNSEAPQVFLNKIPFKGTHPLRVRLVGDAGNIQALGARVTVRVTGMSAQTTEIYGGGGYLSQSSSYLNFAVVNKTGKSEGIEIEVRWPSGEKSVVKCEAGTKYLSIRK